MERTVASGQYRQGRSGRKGEPRLSGGRTKPTRPSARRAKDGPDSRVRPVATGGRRSKKVVFPHYADRRATISEPRAGLAISACWWYTLADRRDVYMRLAQCGEYVGTIKIVVPR